LQADSQKWLSHPAVELGEWKGGADFCTEKIEQESVGNEDARRALKELAEKKVHSASENLSGDNCHGQPPAPKTTLEPAYGSKREQCAQDEERDSDGFAEWREALMGERIQDPYAIEGSALPH